MCHTNSPVTYHVLPWNALARASTITLLESSSLPSVFLALDKQALCREQKKHSAEKTLGEEGFFVECQKKFGKEGFSQIFAPAA
jgi:hypothetical protein